MAIDSFEALFEHELEDVYDAEHELLEALEEMAGQTENEELRNAFEEHRQETEEHVTRLEEAFDIMGIDAEREECEGIEGLIEEHETFMTEEDPDQAVADIHSKMAAEKTEHYEIAAYGNLAFLAERLGMDEVVDLLGQNLEEEREALETLKDLSEDVSAMPIEG
jgi:ferritin-like metal-binding protein YciE